MNTISSLLPKTIIVSSKGQVTIPVGVRRSLSLKEGDQLVCRQTEHGFELSRQPNLREIAEQNWHETKKSTVGKPPLTDDVIREAWEHHVAKKFGA